MSTVTVKVIKTDSDFIEKVSHCVQGEEEGKDWYYMPYWFKKIGEGIYEEYRFEDIPDWLKEEIKDIEL